MIETITIGPVTQYKLTRRFLGKSIYNTSAYFVDGLLIDTGFRHIARDFFETLQRQKIEQIVHTHAHEDHVAANALFQKHLGIIGKIHRAGLHLIHHPPAHLKLYRRLVWDAPAAAQAEIIGNEIETNRYRFQMIELPGHSADHIGFYEPNEGWFFGGDLFLSVKVKVLKYDENIHAWLGSLKKARALPMSRYFCSSSKILASPNEQLEWKIEYYQEVKNRILELNHRGWKPQHLRDEVLGREEILTYVSQGEFSKLNLVKAFLEGEGSRRLQPAN